MKKTSFTVKDIVQLINQLERENNPDNKELILFYKKRIAEETAKAYPSILKKALKTV